MNADVLQSHAEEVRKKNSPFILSFILINTKVKNINKNHFFFSVQVKLLFHKTYGSIAVLFTALIMKFN